MSRRHASSPPVTQDAFQGVTDLPRLQQPKTSPATSFAPRVKANRHTRSSSLDFDTLTDAVTSPSKPRPGSKLISHRRQSTELDREVRSTDVSLSPSKKRLNAATASQDVSLMQNDFVSRNKLTGWLTNMLPTNTNASAKASSNQPVASTSRLNPFQSALDRKWLDKAANYLFDTDANVDKDPSDIWVLGVKHPGYRSRSPSPGLAQSTSSTSSPVLASSPTSSFQRNVLSSSPSASLNVPSDSTKKEKKKGRLKSLSTSPRTSKVKKASSSKRANSNSSVQTVDTALSNEGRTFYRREQSPDVQTLNLSINSQDSDDMTPLASQYLNISSPTSATSTVVTTLDQIPLPTLEQTNGWPPEFSLDFTSRIQLTYRTGFPPIIVPESDQSTSGGNANFSNRSFKDFMGSLASSIGRNGQLSSSSTGGLTCDTGWGCMLRTGQSLLANALAEIHLGRDWRKPLLSSSTIESLSQSTKSTALQQSSSADYVQTQQVLPPHYATYVRLLSWFLDDPSELAPFSVHHFALVGQKLGKAVGQWFGPSTAAGAIRNLCENFTPAGLSVATPMDGSVYKTDIEELSFGWTRPVLILFNVRYGISGVNPIYFPSIKSIFTFPQSVGIAGGRPSSSYYFVGNQGDSLFYIDPHYPKSCIPFRLPQDQDLINAASKSPLSQSDAQGKADLEWDHISTKSNQNPSRLITVHDRLNSFFVSAYAPEDLVSFHPERVRKMPLTGMDPSMLLGFLIRDESDFDDWQTRSALLKPALYTVGLEPPGWIRKTASRSNSAAYKAPTTRHNVDSETDEESDMDWDISDSESEANLKGSSARPISHSFDEDWERPEPV